MLHAPDFLGYESAIHMAPDHADVVKKALELKKVGNDLVILVGGREIHPINVRVGGFYRVPDATGARAPGRAAEVGPRPRARDGALRRLLDFPDFEQDYEFVALRHPDEYPFNEGRLVSSKGLDIPVSEYEEHFIEEHVPHSNALHSVHKGHGAYPVGPLARYSLNFDRLPPVAQEAAREAGPRDRVPQPVQEHRRAGGGDRLRLPRGPAHHRRPTSRRSAPRWTCAPRDGTGHGASEAPRGMLYHRYRLDATGLMQEAKIVPPTSQNQKTIENDLWHFVPTVLDLPKDELTWQCEQAIRNYDPCISCATHFLKLDLRRE